MKINVTRSSMPTLDEYVEEIKKIWDNKWLTNMGVIHQELENGLKRYLDVPHLTLFNNGHMALESIIEAFDLTGEVITSPFTFASTTHAIIRKGLKPVFCDINEEDYTIDVNKIESLITEKTSAIIPVHVYGTVCDMIAIEKLAKKYKLKVIYDAAHVFGVKVDGLSVTRFGDASMLSFHATKVFHTIEGGAVVFKEDYLEQRLNNIKNFGITGLESVEYIGGNAKMNEFQAAMGLCNLRTIDSEITNRKKIVERYRENLNGLNGIKMMKIQKNVESNYAYFPVVFEDYKANRDEIFEKLKEHDIIARKYFYPLANDFGCYKEEFSSESTPVAKYISQRILTLPLYGELPLEEVDRICRIIKDI